MEALRELGGMLCFVVLITAPGAWLAFGLRMPNAPFSLRTALAVTLSPLVLFAEFLLLQPLQLEFAWLPILLATANMPAFLFVARQWRNAPPRFELASIATIAATLAVPVGCLLVPALLWPEQRLFWSHSWMQTDIVYAVANGALRPEEPTLAGVALSYPWAGHVVQGLWSQALGSPPFASYLAANSIFAGAILVFLGALTRSLGGSTLAVGAAIVWLCFGVNFVGYWLADLIVPPEALPKLFGDWRFTPWLWKFRFFNQMPMALAAFGAVVALLATRAQRRLDDGELVLLTALLASVGIVYAVLLPVAYLPALVWMWETIPPRSQRTFSQFARAWFGPLLSLGVVGVISLAHAAAVRIDAGGTGLGPSSALEAIGKLIGALIALSPLLLAGWLCRRHALEARVRRTLWMTAAGSVLLYVALSIPFWSNEYKFVFAAGFALAPFAGVASESSLRTLGRGALPALVAASLLLSTPFLLKLRDPDEHSSVPPVLIDDFSVRLRDDHPLAAATNVIRETTPRDTIVVADASALHLPTLTQRSFYIPPEQPAGHPGVGIPCIEILRYPRAHDLKLLNTREAERDVLFDPEDANWLKFWIGRLLTRGRPLAILFDRSARPKLAAWLPQVPFGELLHADETHAVWLFTPPGLAPRAAPPP